jgi:hypothetical protein
MVHTIAEEDTTAQPVIPELQAILQQPASAAFGTTAIANRSMQRTLRERSAVENSSSSPA